MSHESHTIIGLTGAFGSGCTTASKVLRDNRNFRIITASDFLRVTWAKSNSSPPTRGQLQTLGDELRRANGGGYVVEQAVKSALATSQQGLLVIDGIRNTQEIEYLRQEFGYDFTLFAVLATVENRWDRIASNYTDRGLGLSDFLVHDARDKGEETPYGQQVALCVDGADVIVANNGTTSEFKKKVLDASDLVTGIKVRGAALEEILMNIAYSSSHSSKCVKRHVGAVLADDKGQVISAGYNENPLGTKPCIEEPEYGNQCFRDIVRNKKFEELGKHGTLCPRCATKLIFKPGPPWICENCRASGKGDNLEEFFFPERALHWCTAIHAEVWAILAAGHRATGGVLYTTTFPCSQCAEKIIQSGIQKVVFTEPYPDTLGAQRLMLAHVELSQFEGVRSSSFHRIFGRTVPK